MPAVNPGEVWMTDFGMAAKVRPALILTGNPVADELDLVTLLLHTTALREVFMSNNSKIEWTDATWNPVRGCTKISPGCTHCYAETFAERFRGVLNHPFGQGFELRIGSGQETAHAA